MPTAPKWVIAWLVFSSVVCFFDGFFLINRPRTLPGGDLDWTIFRPWHLYCKYDLRFANARDGVAFAIGWFDEFEVLLNVIALCLMLTKRARDAILLAFTATCFTFWKSTWYLSLFIGPDAAEHKTAGMSIATEVAMIWIPGLVWVIVPLMVIVTLWNKLTQESVGKRKAQ